jgi:hypothetical protein
MITDQIRSTVYLIDPIGDRDGEGAALGRPAVMIGSGFSGCGVTLCVDGLVGSVGADEVS